MKRAIFYAVLGAVVAIVHEAVLARAIVPTVSYGGPKWLLWFLLLPLLDFFGALVLSAKAEHDYYNARQRPPRLKRHYRAVDRPLPEERSATEREMLRHNGNDSVDLHFYNTMHALTMPHGIMQPRGGDALSRGEAK